MKTSLADQYRILVGQGLRAELADLERLVSPVLFSLTMLLLFAFAIGDVEPQLRVHMYLAETFLTALFALQVSFARLFEPDRQDRVFELMRTYPIDHTGWFLAKYTLVLLLGGTILGPTLLFGAFVNQTPSQPLFSWLVVGVSGMALAGLAALGVLLSAMTLKANARQILYPLLYFPLATPVLLAAVQSSQLYLSSGHMTSDVRAWLGLLLGFDVIYITLGALLFTELVDES